MTHRLRGKKEGMLQLFNEQGDLKVGTMITVEPHVILALRKKEKEGYNALQLGSVACKEKVSTKPLLGHFRKAGAQPCRYMHEVKVEDASKFELGQKIDLSEYKEVSHVDVSAVSKGKGFQGVIKRYHFAGGPAAHGSSFHRHGGSTGMRSTPGRCLPGIKKAGRMGGEKITVQNVKVLLVDVEKNLLVVEGSIPGHTGAFVTFAPSVKKKKNSLQKKK